MVTGGGTVSPAVVPGPGIIAGSAPGCVTTATPTPGPDTAGLPPQRRVTENRRSNKPIMEKRRRARINNCLNELKTLILDAMKKDPARHTKLEKADILEMTVKHLENLQRQQVAMSAATDPGVLNKFRAGFSECAGEVGRFPGLESPVRRRLLQHLANCLNGTTTTTTTATSTTSGTTTPQPTPPDPAPVPSQHQTSVQVHILPTSTTTPTVDTHQAPTALSSSSNGIFFTTGPNGGGLQLVPTRLPNGDIALVLPSTGSGTAQIFRQAATITTASPASSPAPSSSSSSSSPLPMLIPIPTRTSSTASASSSTSSSCASTSPIAFDRLTVSSPSQTNPVVNPPVCRDMATSPTAYHLPVSPAAGHRSNGGYSVVDQHPPLRPYSPPLQKPLALVVKKEVVPEVASVEEKPWRPW
ncbi:Protein hairy [Cryptotermes secundus]|nr:protein hairy isoform X1 [Cryptotermes secundus]PNF36023.1 Protein hairy [Cryptotermes secundus]